MLVEPECRASHLSKVEFSMSSSIVRHQVLVRANKCISVYLIGLPSMVLRTIRSTLSLFVGASTACGPIPDNHGFGCW